MSQGLLNPEHINKAQYFGLALWDSKAKKGIKPTTNWEYGVVVDNCTWGCDDPTNRKCASHCPAGYKWVGNVSGDAGRTTNIAGGQTKTCGGYDWGAAMCGRVWPSTQNENTKLSCCMGKYGDNPTEGKRQCHPTHYKNSGACDQFMTELCQRDAYKDTRICSCFQKGLTIDGPDGKINFPPHCFATDQNRCSVDAQAGKAYITTQQNQQQCPALSLCDIKGNTLNVKGDVKITQKCDFKRDPATGKFVPAGTPTKPEQQKPAGTKPDTKPPAAADQPWYQRGFKVGQTNVPYAAVAGGVGALVLLTGIYFWTRD